jgi:hypothetical protein
MPPFNGAGRSQPDCAALGWVRNQGPRLHRDRANPNVATIAVLDPPNEASKSLYLDAAGSEAKAMRRIGIASPTHGGASEAGIGR